MNLDNAHLTDGDSPCFVQNSNTLSQQIEHESLLAMKPEMTYRLTSLVSSGSTTACEGVTTFPLNMVVYILNLCRVPSVAEIMNPTNDNEQPSLI